MKIKQAFWMAFAMILGLAYNAFSFAQSRESGNEVDEVVVEATERQGQDEDADGEIDEIVVTGSRLRRDTYTSISPLQVISGDISREAGLIDATAILQDSTAAAGQQVDLTFSGFVLDDGPGSTSLDLRGLGASRTLILVNGRRVAPAGVEGAPGNPNLGFIPGTLISRYELLLDGASSVYGSDAVAGVTNAILRKDFDGFDARIIHRENDHSAGPETGLTLTWGRDWDRGFVGMGLEYREGDKTTLNDLPWTRGCESHHEITTTGETRSRDLYYSRVLGMDLGGCRIGSLAGWVRMFSLTPAGSGDVFYTQGYSNGGWPNFSRAHFFGEFGVDGDNDGTTDVNYADRNLNGRNQHRTLTPDYDRTSFMAYGEYTFEGDTNLTLYFETLYGQAAVTQNSGGGQLFPVVPSNNPFNICNPNAPNGVDCRQAYRDLLENPYVAARLYGHDDVGECDLVTSDCGLKREADGTALTVIPIVRVQGDRNIVETDVEQLRVVGGVRMDLPFMNIGSLGNWQLDTSIIYSHSNGESHRWGIREDRLNLALGRLTPGGMPCGSVHPTLFARLEGADTPIPDDLEQGCVPVNMFAPSLYSSIPGDFATPAERDYLFDDRDFDTEYTQTILQAYADGTLFSMPGGDVVMGFGLEWRNDDISSKPDHVARDGLFFGFFSDGGAEGDKDTKEAYAEIELPLLGGRSRVEELTLSASVRWTDDELYGDGTTYAAKLGYRPVSSLLLRATRGTSFRAPNLREVYLRPQTGFLTLFDPCLIPRAAQDNVTGAYIAANDEREAHVLRNCQENGVDPTMARSNNGLSTYSVEVAAGGSPGLDAEESDSYSVGFSWEQPFTTAFDLSLGMTYYEIEIKDTIIEPGAQFIINDCYGSLTGNSAFCSRITRQDTGPPLLDMLDRGFINRDEEDARGIDVNLTFDDTWTIFGRPIEIGAELNANHTKSRTTLFVDDEGNQDFNQLAGEWYFPDWRGNMTIRANWDNWRLFWRADYLSGMDQDPADIDSYQEAIDGNTSTCLGPPNDVLCRDYAESSDYFTHTASVTYQRDDWLVRAGIDNVFDERPPRVDGTELTSINNVPLGIFDVLGRTYFVDFQYKFGGFR